MLKRRFIQKICTFFKEEYGIDIPEDVLADNYFPGKTIKAYTVWSGGDFYIATSSYNLVLRMVNDNYHLGHRAIAVFIVDPDTFNVTIDVLDKEEYEKFKNLMSKVDKRSRLLDI